MDKVFKVGDKIRHKEQKLFDIFGIMEVVEATLHSVKVRSDVCSIMNVLPQALMKISIPEYKPGMVIPLDGIKDTNPKDTIGITKLPFSTISGPAMGELGLAMLEGALKYGRHNYRAIGIRYSVYFDAAMRHIWSWWEGEDIDPDSGLPHIVKAMACLMILRDATIQGKYNDDRPPKTPKCDYGKRTWVDGLNARTKALREKYPDPKEPYTEKEGE